MKSRFFVPVLILIVLLALPSTLCAYRLNRVWERRFEVDEGARLIIENVNGSIDVEGWGNEAIEIVAKIRIKAPSKSNANKIFRKIEFDVDADAGMVDVRADLPRLRRTGLFSFFGESNLSITITYIIKVPYRTNIELESVNGKISVEDVEGMFFLKTVNGSIDIHSPGGEGEIKSVNGGIDCVIKEFPEGGELTIKTVNGGVRVELPDDTGAELDIRTLNGRARTDFDLGRVRKIKRTRIQGEIGDGNGYIYIRTTNGGISVRHR